MLTDVVAKWELTVPERELSRNSRWDESLSLRSPRGLPATSYLGSSFTLLTAERES